MKLYADGGVWEGERILAEDYVKLATTLRNESATEIKVNPPAKDNFVGYGYQIWMCRPKGVYRADGAMGQFTIVVPDRDMLIAITENAAGATGGVAPQQTLDYMWEFLDEIPAGKGEPIAAGAEQEALVKRMKALALPKPLYAPFSPLQEKICGKTIRLTEGRLGFGDMAGIFMGGNRMPEGISEMVFRFNGDLCRMEYTQEGEKTTVTVAMNGGYADNTIGNGIVTRALASGAWVKENVFRLTLRWIETCNQRKYDFSFDGEDVKAEQVDAPRFSFMREPGEVKGKIV
jgi:hypothetical protein